MQLTFYFALRAHNPNDPAWLEVARCLALTPPDKWHPLFVDKGFAPFADEMVRLHEHCTAAARKNDAALIECIHNDYMKTTSSSSTNKPTTFTSQLLQVCCESPHQMR